MEDDEFLASCWAIGVDDKADEESHNSSVESEIEEVELLDLEEAMNNIPSDEEDREVWYLSESENVEEEETVFTETNPSNIHGKKRPMLTNELRKQLVCELFAEAKNLVLPRGSNKYFAEKYCVHRTTISTIWRHSKRQKKEGKEINVSHRKKNCGRKPLISDDAVLKDVPLKQRTTLRSFATALQVSASTVYRLLKRGVLRSHTNSIKPKLTSTHKIQRLQFIMSKVIPRTITQFPRFELLQNMIHIDEKWFFMSRITQRFYLLVEEEDPYRSCQSKNFITKVMFLAAIGRPIFGQNAEILWDGKIGIFPFTDNVAAKRTSKNREKGTIETKAKQQITREVIRDKIINELLPAIRSKWPVFASKTIWIQQDNARPHIQPNDTEFVEAATQDGFDMHLICQPAQSPDLNVLDLGFFRAIQSIQHQKFPETVDELVQSVEDAYQCYDPKIINYTWLHLMYVMVEILKVKGGNNYKNPHKGKKRLDRLGQLPTVVEVPQELVTETVKILNEGIIFGAVDSSDHQHMD